MGGAGDVSSDVDGEKGGGGHRMTRSGCWRCCPCAVAGEKMKKDDEDLAAKLKGQ